MKKKREMVSWLLITLDNGIIIYTLLYIFSFLCKNCSTLKGIKNKKENILAHIIDYSDENYASGIEVIKAQSTSLYPSLLLE